MEELKTRYEGNVASLLAYRRNFIKSFPAFNELGFLCIPRSDTEFYLFKKEKQSFEGMVDIAQQEFAFHKNLSEVAPVMAANLFDVQELQALHIVLNETFIYDAKVPIYLVWELEWIPVYLQLSDYRPIIATESFSIRFGFTGCVFERLSGSATQIYRKHYRRFTGRYQ